MRLSIAMTGAIALSSQSTKSAALELQRGNIDGDGYRRQTARMPIKGVGDRLLDDPLADIDHESRLLQDLDDSGRRTQHPVGVPPAEQCFDTRDPAGVKKELRLVMEHEFPAFDRMPQLLLQGHSLVQHRVHSRRVLQVSFAVCFGALDGALLPAVAARPPLLRRPDIERRRSAAICGSAGHL